MEKRAGRDGQRPTPAAPPEGLLDAPPAEPPAEQAQEPAPGRPPQGPPQGPPPGWQQGPPPGWQQGPPPGWPQGPPPGWQQGPPPGWRPGAPPGIRPPQPPPPPPDEATLRAASRASVHVVLLILAGLATSALPLPWQVASLGFTLTAIVVGVRALRRVRRPGRRDPITPLLLFGLMFAALMTLSTAGTLVLWPAQMARQDCLSTAVTISAREQCEADYEADLRDRLEQLTSRP